MGESIKSTPEQSFATEFCVPFLLGAQNPDGGFGFRPGAESRVEPTCWAVRALQNAREQIAPESLQSARKYLLSSQLADGSWPAVAGNGEGSWVTSLACSVLSVASEGESSVRAGLRWLCADYPRDSSPWRRLIGRLRGAPRLTELDSSCRGWGWTPRTSSWVEPTSFALFALEDAPDRWLPPESSQRRKLAEAMLYDRTCPGGGWNCGNPSVYGVAGETLVLPTSWALLALRAYPNRAENVMSLDWLGKNISNVRSAGSLAVARICLEAYDRRWPAGTPDPAEFHTQNGFLENVLVAAWTCLALNPQRSWFPAGGSNAD
jgi:prenyltransferase/squalene oxidase-like repeat protein